MEQQQTGRIVDQDGKPITTTKSASLATQPIRIDAGRLDLLDPELPDEGMVRQLEQRAIFREKIIQLALRQTSPSQYVIHRAEGDESRESVYPMGAAADAMFSFLGLTWAVAIEEKNERGETVWRRGDKKWHAEVRQAGEKARDYWVESALWSRDQLVALAEGKRRIGVGYSKDEATSEMNAFENLKSRAVRDVLGLKGKDRAWYKAQGLDLSTARVAEFQDRSAASSSDPTEAVIKWGKAKGQRVSELSDEDLRFYTERQEKDLVDPAKERWKANNERLLAALKAEVARRAAKPVEDAAQAEEYDRTILLVREEGAAANANPKKLEEYIAGLKTLDQAKKALEFYRKKREAKSSETKA